MTIAELCLFLTLLGLPAFLLRVSLFGLAFNGLDILLVVSTLLALPAIIKLFRRPPFWVWLSLGILIAGAISVMIAPHKQLALGAYKSWIALPITFAWAVAALGPSWTNVRRSLLLSAFLASLYALVTALVLHQSRLQGWYDSPNFFAMMAVPILLINLPWEDRTLLSPWSGLWAVVLIAFGLTFSFGGLFALAGGLVICWLARRNYRSLVAIGLGLVSLVAIALTYLPEQALSIDFKSRTGSFASRWEIWHAAQALTREHPLLGIGLRQFQSAYQGIIPRIAFPPIQWVVPEPHNLFLALWLNLGLAGVILFGLIFYGAIRQLYQRLPKPAASLILAAMASLIIHGSVDTPYFQNDLAVIFWTLIAMSYAPILDHETS